MRLGLCLILMATCLSLAEQTAAQKVDIQVAPSGDGRVVIDFVFSWDESLRSFVDSSNIALWTPAALEALSGGLTESSYTLELPSLVTPQLLVLQRQFDEVEVDIDPDVSLPPANDAWSAGLGWYRRRPVTEIVASVFRLDRPAGTLRRYRHLRISVNPVFVGKTVSTTSPTMRARTEVANSSLSDGTLFRISITESGIYRISRAYLLSLGLNPDSIDPDQIEILGNGGRPLPALNGAVRIHDLMSQPVVRTGGGDGNFGSADEVVFYAAAPRGWQYEDGRFNHFVHPFSNDNAVILKVGAGGGPSIEVHAFDANASPVLYTSTTGRQFVDIEERIWSKEHHSGQDWMSNTIRSGGERQIFSALSLPGLLSGSVQYEVRVAIASNPRATVAMLSSGVTLAQRTAPQITRAGAENPSAIASTFSFLQSVNSGQTLDLSMRLLNQVNEPEAALDWVRMTYEQDLMAAGAALEFTTRPEVSGAQQYRMRGFSTEPRVWDVTDGVMNHAYEVVPVGGEFTIHISADDVRDRARDLIAFTADDIQTLSGDFTTPLENQNLHGVAGFPDLVIVSPAGFLPAADRLAEHRRTDGLDVVVVTQAQVFNEFSGSVPDMRAVRDYMKFLYDRAPINELPRYLLLMGDGHYDYRELSNRQNRLNNLIFPYETEETLRTDASFTSDDYFGLLDDNEGLWTYVTFTTVSTERVDIGIGRFPAQTLSEAETIVDKIISYEDPSTFGSWRSQYTMVADDGPTGLSASVNDRDLHLANVDQVAELVAQDLYPQINIRKIYGEMFERVFLNGFRIPDARKEINEALERGTLLFNYSGHGGPDGLAQEEIFTIEDAEALTNSDKLTVFLTATCSFGWWDLEDKQSGAEVLLLNPNGGAVALLTTVRLVYTSGSSTTLNAGLNRALNVELFTFDDQGKPRRLGDVLALTKNTNVGLQGNSRKFNLLGDPSMRIGLPHGEAVVKTLNQTSIDTDLGQMKALDRVSIGGQIVTAAGNVDTSFNGTVNITVFDAERIVPIKEHRFNTKSYFRQREDLLWRGDVRASSGEFTAEFVVPKDISYSNKPGRISIYAADDRSHAIGYSENFLVGGTSDNPPNDLVGPDIKLFLNDSTFVSGETVGSDPELIVQLFDTSGINTVGTGVGHEMLLLVDDDDRSARDIGSAFVSEPNSFQRGNVRWRLDDLAPGPHTLSVRAWDVLNNSNTAELSFNIANDEVLDVSNVYNYPNPMNRETRFVFEHNQPPGTPAEVQIRIFTLSGRPIRTIYSDEALPEGVLGSGPLQVYWDGKDEDLDRPATGVYLYRLRVVTHGSDGEKQVSEHVEKLVIIR